VDWQFLLSLEVYHAGITLIDPSWVCKIRAQGTLKSCHVAKKINSLSDSSLSFYVQTHLRQVVFESTCMKILDPQQSVFQLLLYSTTNLLAGILLEEQQFMEY